jgi:four helix bundle protein
MPNNTLQRGKKGGRDIQFRAEQFALAAIRLLRGLPQTPEGRLIAGQMLRSATSVAANYRAVCRARSRREFVAKLGVVIEESDETLYWLELMRELGLGDPEQREGLWVEADQLLAIFIVSRATATKQAAGRSVPRPRPP